MARNGPNCVKYGIYEPKCFVVCTKLQQFTPYSKCIYIFTIFIDIWTIYGAILTKIGLFLENGHYLVILFGTRATRTRAQDISGNIDPIDLKFGGMIYQCIPNRITNFIFNFNLLYYTRVLHKLMYHTKPSNSYI